MRIYQIFFSPDHSFWAKGLNRCFYCQHIPTCSEYMIEAIQKRGTCIGFFLGIKRLLRCHPWSRAWYDPVPLSQKEKN